MLPVDLMIDLSATGPTIAVDIEKDNEPQFNEAFPPVISGWKEFFKKFIPFIAKPRKPSLINTLMTSAYLNSSYQKDLILYNKKTADIIISPPLKDISSTNFDDIDKIINYGYNHTQKVIDTILKTL